LERVFLFLAWLFFSILSVVEFQMLDEELDVGGSTPFPDAISMDHGSVCAFYNGSATILFDTASH
jgi:hypothetical protein